MTEGNYMTKSEHPELGKLAGSDGLASAMNGNYPVLVTSASLPSIREQADRLRCFLADDSNEFNEAWLEEQQHRLNAVHSYVRDKKLRAELSHCQRWVELRIGGWLGPTQQGDRTDLTSLPGNEVKINNRHKHEFRLLAENKATVTAVLEDHKGVKITRAALLRLAAWQEALAKSKHQEAAPALYLGDFRQIELQPESIDWVITDPPYAKEYLPLYSDLSRCARRWLKPGGSLLVMSGQSYLEEVVHALSSHLTYRWQLTYLTPGGQSAQVWDRTVNTFWKCIFWHVKGNYEGPWIGDVCKSAVNDNDKDHHVWGQSESGLYDLMKRFCQPGQRVLDPMMGAGTTGVVALKLGCEFIGIDLAEEHYQTARKRLCGRYEVAERCEP